MLLGVPPLRPFRLDAFESEFVEFLSNTQPSLTPVERSLMSACTRCVVGTPCEHGGGSRALQEWREVFVEAWGVHYWVRTASLVAPTARFRTWRSPFHSSYTHQHPPLSFVDHEGSFRLYAGLQWHPTPEDDAGSDRDA